MIDVQRRPITTLTAGRLGWVAHMIRKSRSA
jgi:hypothetical protein